MFFIICGLIWELIVDIIKRPFKPYPMDYDSCLKRVSQRNPNLETDYGEEWCKEQDRRSAVDGIEFDIFLDFYSNMEHKEKYIQSYVDYEGERTYIAFYDWRQKPLRCLADYIYKRKEVTNVRKNRDCKFTRKS